MHLTVCLDGVGSLPSVSAGPSQPCYCLVLSEDGVNSSIPYYEKHGLILTSCHIPCRHFDPSSSSQATYSVFVSHAVLPLNVPAAPEDALALHTTPAKPLHTTFNPWLPYASQASPFSIPTPSPFLSLESSIVVGLLSNPAVWLEQN